MELEAIVSQAKAQIDAASDAATLDQVRVEFMGKKGKLTDLLKGLGQLSAEERPLAGQKINVAKQEIQQAISAKGDALRSAELNKKLAEEAVDVTLPGRTELNGNLHPV
ncbi:MAG TPA: phenylalanine--tRNA ligase subunit alpha, partial [Alteromonas sp.]|nr:phenylalanine--tRNA ligase subunit alpha [Alteromonas sp.]